MAPIVCSLEEYQAARTARTRLIEGARAVRVTIDGDSTEFTQVSLPQLNETIAGMQAYQNLTSGNGVVAFNIHGCKGF
ncbi:gpW family head-tail joining protein [Desulfotalea psychrophila]|uniref:gpW family head-tail joining protein n=1 Tax=Desulfotalea psychrophila TaxID=84980 RepID=UPI0002DF9127|nr:gpW family head-tail joining protein [Desulfotalea psychrophila]